MLKHLANLLESFHFVCYHQLRWNYSKLWSPFMCEFMIEFAHFNLFRLQNRELKINVKRGTEIVVETNDDGSIEVRYLTLTGLAKTLHGASLNGHNHSIGHDRCEEESYPVIGWDMVIRLRFMPILLETLSVERNTRYERWKVSGSPRRRAQKEQRSKRHQVEHHKGYWVMVQWMGVEKPTGGIPTYSKRNRVRIGRRELVEQITNREAIIRPLPNTLTSNIQAGEDQPQVLVQPPTLQFTFGTPYKGVEVRERLQIFYTADTFVLDNPDVIDSFVLEVPNELLNLKEGVHTSLPKYVDASFVVDISKGEGIT
ncbi:hypothetical protein Syun_003663 [Stephania yunnanensis]|uniref:Uncharacterized protein n=1 Tax=Stephania yunnanensis TaxID=152371 RepID=A0AAP0Q444_9MAGN